VQTAGNLVGVVVKLTARVQHGHDDLGGGAVFLGMQIDRDAAAVVGDGDGFVGVDDDRDVGAVAGQGLVDRVVDDLEHHVVEAGAVVRVADVHPWAFTDRVESLQNL